MPRQAFSPTRSTAKPKLRNFKYYSRIPLYGCLVAGILSADHCASAATTTLVWDTSTATTGAQDGAGTWDSTSNTWWNGSADQAWTNSTALAPVIAQFGSNSGTLASRTVTLSSSFQVAGLNFGAITGSLSATNPAYTLTGGTINFDSGSTITVADGTSASGSFISLNSVLAGSNVTIQKASGSTTEQFVQLGATSGTVTNTWTGTLTIGGGNGGLFVRSSNAVALNSLSTVVVSAGSTLNLQGTTTYTSDFVVSGKGSGTSPRGAIRFDPGMTLSGNIIMAGNTTLNFQTSTPAASNVVFTGGIKEQGGSFNFTKTGLGDLTLRGASTYTGSTIVAPDVTGVDPGNLVLDFINSTVTDNLLYNGVASGSEGALFLTGNTARANSSSTATLIINGKDATANTQSFGGLTVSGPTAITVQSGLIGSVDLSLGAITRTGVGTTLNITGPASGSITTTTNLGTLLGTWATYTNADGISSWAKVNSDGTLDTFTGDKTYVANGDLSSTSTYPATSNLAITNTSGSGAVTQSGNASVNTITMLNTNFDRVVTVGAGHTLTLGQTGGIQLTSGAHSLTIGAAGNAGTLTAGSAAGAELFLSNYDSLNTITINSVIADNSLGAVNLVVNGLGTTILTGANTYTGATIITSGTLQIQSATALGSTSGTTTVGTGATLALANGITVTEPLTLSGTLRNAIGDNTYSGLITPGASGGTITADTGTTLTLFRTSAATSIISDASNITFGGAGTINVNSIISTPTGSTGTLTKADSGTLVLNAANTYNGSTSITGGILRLTIASGLGTTAGGTSVSSGATLELTNGITVGAEALSLNGTGVNNIGALHSVGTNTYGGKITLGSAARINSDSGTLTLGTSSISGAFALTFGGTGDINVTQPITISSGTLIKDGTGTLTLSAGNTYTGSTTISGGTIAMSANDTFSDSAAIIVDGGILSMGAFTDTVGVVTLRHGSITGTGTLTSSNASGFALQDGSVSVNLAGTASLTKSTTGTVILSGTNTYSGATSVTGGILRITNAAALGSTTAGTSVSSGATLELANNIIVGAEALTINGTGVGSIGALHSVGNNTYGGKITLGSATRINSDSGTLTLNDPSGISGAFTLTLGGTGDILITQAIGTGSGGLTKDGTGTLTLAAGNTYTGTTTINGGTIAMTGNDTFSDSAALLLDGGSLAMGSFSDTVGAVTLRRGSITGTGTLTNSSTSNFAVQDGSISVNLAATVATVGLTKNSSGTVTLSGVNTYTGTTTVSDGRLILDYSGGNIVLPTTDAVNLNGGILEVRGASAPTAVKLGAIATTASTGMSTLVVDANTALTATSYTRNSGTALFIDLSAAGSSLAFTTAPAVVNGVVTGAAGGNAAVVMKDSNGRADFAAVGSGNTIVRLNATTALPASGSVNTTNYLLKADGSTLSLSGSETVSTLRIDTTANSGTLDLAGNTLTFSLLALLMDGSNDFTITNTGSTGTLSGPNAVFIYQFGTGKLTLNAQITGTTTPQTFLMGTGLIDWTAAAGNSGANYILGSTVRLSGTGLSLSSGVTGNGTGVLNIGNNGILELNSGNFTRAVGNGTNLVNFYSGGGGFSAYGADRTVNLGGASASLTWGGTNFLASGSKLILGSPYANATVDFQNGLGLNGGNQTVEVQSQNVTGVGGKISGVISGSGTFAKTGQGILNLSAANTYSGATFVKAGTLLVSGSINGNAAVSVDANAELKLTGTGTVGGTTLTLADSSKLSLEVGSLSTAPITLTGSTILNGTVNLALTLTADPVDGTLFTLIDGNSPLLGYSTGARFAANGSALAEGASFLVTTGSFSQVFTISYVGGADGNDVTLLAIPEPSTLWTLCASVGFTLGIGRFRRRRSSHLATVS